MKFDKESHNNNNGDINQVSQRQTEQKFEHDVKKHTFGQSHEFLHGKR